VAAQPLPSDHITSKTYYDMIHHPPESTDWLNVLLAQAILQYREDAKINDRLMRAVDDILNGGVKSNFLVRIHHVEKKQGQKG
jgi:maintenance of morphology protein 1